MKRDMDLVRKILFCIEDEYTAGKRLIQINIDDYDSATIFEHCKLAYQAGLIQDFRDASTLSYSSCMVGNLTNAGYDLLDKIREDTTWNRTKTFIKEKGLPMVIETVKTVANTLISSATEGAISALMK